MMFDMHMLDAVKMLLSSFMRRRMLNSSKQGNWDHRNLNYVSCQGGIWKAQKGSRETLGQGTIGCTPNSVPMVLIGLI